MFILERSEVPVNSSDLGYLVLWEEAVLLALENTLRSLLPQTL
jgi:hypothetical protein